MTYVLAWSGGVPYIFDTKKGKNHRSSCCYAAPRAGRSKSRQYSRKKPASGMHSSCIASFAFGVLFPEKTPWRMAYFVVAAVPDSVAITVCRPRASGCVGA